MMISCHDVIMIMIMAPLIMIVNPVRMMTMMMMMMVVVVVISSNDFPIKSQYNPYKVGPQGTSLFAISVFFTKHQSHKRVRIAIHIQAIHIYVYQQT